MNAPSDRLGDRNAITASLRRLGERLAARGIIADIYIFGGAAMARAYDARRATRDIDAVFQPHGIVVEEARAVAVELPASVYVAPSGDPSAPQVFDHPGLRSVVSGTLNADQLTVTGNVFLNAGSQLTDIDLPGANIGGNLEVNNGSVVSGALDADRATVAGNVDLRDGSQFTDIRTVDADIGGLILLDGATWEPGGSLDLRQARAGAVLTLGPPP